MIVGRRRLLALGLAAAGMTVAGCSASSSEQERTPRRAVQPDPPSEPGIVESEMPVIRSEFVFSESRDTSVELILSYPSGLKETRNLPVVLYLHGKDGVKPTPIPFETLAALELEHRAGALQPFGFVTVDGGYNPYWFDGSPNGDLMTMLTEELPGWLRERGLGGPDGVPFASSGISTGGFGALNYAIERSITGDPVSRVATLAPAMPVDWARMREKDVFATKSEWQRSDPLHRIGNLGDVPVGLWIGEHDPFLPGAERLAKRHANMPVFDVIPGGGHEPAVFEVVGKDMVHFLAEGIGAAD